MTRIDRTFALIEAAALAGERCPKNKPFGPLSDHAMTELYRSGRIRAEIFARNFRRITLLHGPHRGKMTVSPPPGTKLFKVIDREKMTGFAVRQKKVAP